MSRRIDLQDEFEMEALEVARENNVTVTRTLALGWLMGRFKLPYDEAMAIALVWYGPIRQPDNPE